MLWRPVPNLLAPLFLHGAFCVSFLMSTGPALSLLLLLLLFICSNRERNAGPVPPPLSLKGYSAPELLCLYSLLCFLSDAPCFALPCPALSFPRSSPCSQGTTSLPAQPPRSTGGRRSAGAPESRAPRLPGPKREARLPPAPPWTKPRRPSSRASGAAAASSAAAPLRCRAASWLEPLRRPKGKRRKGYRRTRRRPRRPTRLQQRPRSPVMLHPGGFLEAAALLAWP